MLCRTCEEYRFPYLRDAGRSTKAGVQEHINIITHQPKLLLCARLVQRGEPSQLLTPPTVILMRTT